MKRSVIAAVVTAVIAALCLAGTPGQVANAGAPVERRAAPAGLAGSPIVLATSSSIHGVDIAMGPDGTAYVGWIAGIQGGSRTVFACVLPPGATACLNGGQSTSALDIASATDLHVVPPITAQGNALLLWFHDTVDSVSSEFGGRIAMSTLTSAGVLGGGNDILPLAPSFGRLLTAKRAPNGNVWLIQQEDAANGDEIRVVPSIGSDPTTLTAPWAINKARLGFTGTGRAVIVVSRAGGFGEALKVVRQNDTGWSSFANVAGTWSTGGSFDVATQNGVKLVASINNASYYPRIANWTGSEFGSFTLTGDKTSCPKYSHDLFPDLSGRLADAYFDCDKVVIANHPKAKTAAFARFPAGGTPVVVGEPQIATTPRGLGWVAWSRQDTVGNRLLVVPIRLPAQKTTKSNSSGAGKVTVTGPVSCLPAVSTQIGVAANPAAGWSVVSKTLKLDGSVHSQSLDGATLSPGSSHTVTGSVKFKKGGQTQTVSAQLNFAACPSP